MIDQRRAQRPSDHGVVGWISTTDVMMLGLILMFTLAMFAQAKLARIASVAPTDPNAKVRTLSQALIVSQQELEQLQKELKTKRNELTDVRKRLESVEQKLRLSERSIQQLMEEKDRLTHQLAVKRTEFESKEAALAKTESALEEAKPKLVLAEAWKKKAEMSQLRITELEERIRKLGDLQKRVNREMIGLRGGRNGELGRTAVLIDASGSMDGKRWRDAVDVMATWMENLPVNEVVLIIFNEKAWYLADEKNAVTSLVGESGIANRRKLVEKLRNEIHPVGGTFTRGALELAYGRGDIDSIILFTDGAPNTGGEAIAIPSEMEAIYALISQHAGVPINAVGVGEYFQPELSSFLLRIGRETNGTFLGR